jgi:N-acetylglucosamine malate deacetylase 1
LIVLFVASHPDDEILGCGGMMAKLASEGHLVATLFLTGGITSRHYDSKKEKLADFENLHQNALKANELVGVKSENVFFLNHLDQQLDTVIFQHLVNQIKKVVTQLMPEKVFTHHPGDYNKDHRICYEATLYATRVSPGEFFPKELYTYEVASSTERSFGSLGPFIPNVYIDIQNHIESKCAALTAYVTELKSPPHPRSVEGIFTQSRWREVGLKHAEAFHLVRKIDWKSS